MKPPYEAIAAALAVLCFSIAMLAFVIVPHPNYTPDGIVYARFAARDAGESARQATLDARAFYDQTPLMRSPRYRALIDLAPSVAFAKSRVFANRVLYPWVVGLALHAAGFHALFLVSAAAYAAFGLALFWALCALGRPAFAAIVTLGALSVPLLRQLGASDLTDMLAMFWWALALGALLRLLGGANRGLLLLLALASIGFCLTRPTPYLIVLPAAALFALRPHNGGAWAFLASLAGAAAYAAAAFAVHAYGLSAQLHWVYVHQPNGAHEAFAPWYRSSLLQTLHAAVSQTFRTVVPILASIVLAYEIVRARTRPAAIVLCAAIAASLLSIPFNPVASSLARVVLVPLIPVFGAIAVLALGLLQRKGAVTASRPVASTVL